MTKNASKKPAAKPSPKETLYKAKDMRILREGLVWAYKRMHPMHQPTVDAILKRFAKSIQEYCLCEDNVYIKAEDKCACLNCGKRHPSPKK